MTRERIITELQVRIMHKEKQLADHMGLVASLKEDSDDMDGYIRKTITESYRDEIDFFKSILSIVSNGQN